MAKTNHFSIIYHSGFGHTKVVAECILKGIISSGEKSNLLSVDDLMKENSNWDIVNKSECIIFGSPTYMGSASAKFKEFMEATSSNIWKQQLWKDKFAAGFTNSGCLSGDKLITLIEMSVFAAQHGMVWISSGLLPTGNTEEDLNRVGTWLGCVTQSNANETPDKAPHAGDKKYAEAFGKRVADFVMKHSS